MFLFILRICRKENINIFLNFNVYLQIQDFNSIIILLDIKKQYNIFCIKYLHIRFQREADNLYVINQQSLLIRTQILVNDRKSFKKYKGIKVYEKISEKHRKKAVKIKLKLIN